MNLNELASQIHQENIAWWQDPSSGKPITRNKGELLMMVITELAEAVEGIRKNLMDDKLPHRKMEEVEMADAVIRLLDFAGGFKLKLCPYEWTAQDITNRPDNKAEFILDLCGDVCQASTIQTDRLAGVISYAIFEIRIYCAKHSLDLEGAMNEKRAYNRTRKDHTHEARMQDGGKRF